MKISFKGDVFLAGSTKQYTKPNEVKQMKKYANKNDCDVVVLNKEFTQDEKYQALIIKEDKYIGYNIIDKKVFDFSKGVKV